MKTLATLSLISIFSSSIAFAGGFGGPAPFQNESPLPTGTDGTYQCVASGLNATGLITWQINNGVQTSATADNKWIMFVDGQVLSGQTSANISDGKVAGVLDTTVSGALPTADDGTISLPIVFVVPGNAGAGRFNGSIDLKSPVAAIEGSGELRGTPERTDQIVFIQDAIASQIQVIPPTILIRDLTIPGSQLEDLSFKIRGTRLSTSAIASSVAENLR
jgi:hypothetical protein